MSLKWLLGGEVNHKFIEKQQHKDYKQWIEDEKEFDALVLKHWNKAQNPIEARILKLIENNKTDPDYPRRFFLRHPELLPHELNPFIKNQTNTEDILDKKQRYIDELVDWNKELQEENHKLKLKLSNEQS